MRIIVNEAETTALHERHAAIGWLCLDCPRPLTVSEPNGLDPIEK